MATPGKAPQERPLLWGVLYPLEGPLQLILAPITEATTYRWWYEFLVPSEVYDALQAVRIELMRKGTCYRLVEGVVDHPKDMMILSYTPLFFDMPSPWYRTNPYFNQCAGPVLLARAPVIRSAHYCILKKFQFNSRITWEDLENISRFVDPSIDQSLVTMATE